MFDFDKLLTNRHIYSYLPAVLRENKSDWRIEYYVENPQTKKLVRRRLRVGKIVSRYEKKRDARLHIYCMLCKKNVSLFSKK